jgi:hypothetical protein
MIQKLRMTKVDQAGDGRGKKMRGEALVSFTPSLRFKLLQESSRSLGTMTEMKDEPLHNRGRGWGY